MHTAPSTWPHSQAVGLCVCAALTRRAGVGGGVHWGALTTNGAAVALLLACSTLPCADGAGVGCSSFLAKFRTTACGAMSISAGLAAIAHSRYTARAHGARLAALNLGLHAYLALAAAQAMLWVAPAASAEAAGRDAVNGTVHLHH